MNWTAIVPLKLGPERKSRLASRFSAPFRAALSDHMAQVVVDTLHACPSIDRVILLSPHPVAPLAAEWRADDGRGLNEELEALRQQLELSPLLIIHSDLPLVTPDDIKALVAAADQKGCALAPDRHGAGTNAAAIGQGQVFTFAFGEGSLARHVASAPCAAIVSRPGLSIDIDTPEDLDAALAAGLTLKDLPAA